MLIVNRVGQVWKNGITGYHFVIVKSDPEPWLPQEVETPAFLKIRHSVVYLEISDPDSYVEYSEKPMEKSRWARRVF
jgi:hypothetical protein